MSPQLEPPQQLQWGSPLAAFSQETSLSSLVLSKQFSFLPSEPEEDEGHLHSLLKLCLGWPDKVHMVTLPFLSVFSDSFLPKQFRRINCHTGLSHVCGWEKLLQHTSVWKLGEQETQPRQAGAQKLFRASVNELREHRYQSIFNVAPVPLGRLLPQAGQSLPLSYSHVVQTIFQMKKSSEK